jgi:nicotinic acid phosphoribosyltransferase
MPDLLETDGYKFSMAEAGWPLREETFYYSHRRGGPHYLPFDPVEMVKKLLPDMSQKLEARGFLDFHDYQMGGGFWKAMLGEVKIKGMPKGSWFFDREPVFTVTGPSAIVSWLEPLVLQLHYRIQVATIAKLEPERLPEFVFPVTCEEQRDIVLETLAAVGVKAPSLTVDPITYIEGVTARMKELVDIAGDPTRIFEVGMRAAFCQSQHRMALEAAKEGGLKATSNVYLARELNLKPVGTMGHEHVQRYGGDEVAFRAMRDRFPGASSFLVDTFSTLDSGIPAAFKLIAEDPSRRDTIRFDSGDIESQYLYACQKAKAMGISPRFILEDGFTADRMRAFEKLREFTGLDAEDQLYGFGGYIVRDRNTELTRDRVAAVWKLTQTADTPTMKFGDEPGAGKESIPGKPVLYRRYGPIASPTMPSGWHGLVAQEGEFPDRISGANPEQMNMFHPDYSSSRRLRFDAGEAKTFAARQGARPFYSPATQSLVHGLYARRHQSLGSNWSQILPPHPHRS